MLIEEMCIKAKQAGRFLSTVGSLEKNRVLKLLAERLWDCRRDILEANNRDVEAAKKGGLSESLIDRLLINEDRLSSIIHDLINVIDLPDPVGCVFDQKSMPNGLRVFKQRVPLGVVAVIYESRPNVTIDVVGLTIKSGNAVILRGGSETIQTNLALVLVIRGVLEECKFPVDGVQFIDDPDRERVVELLKMHHYIDMLIPRGGAELHKYCRENSKIPVITGGIGICHLFVDETANLAGAINVIQNAKVQRPTVCNALDTVLVHEKIAKEFIPEMVKELVKYNVTFRADPDSLSLLSDWPQSVVAVAGPEDFDTEWLSLVLGIKIVHNIDEAIEHIILHSTGHSDGILTNDLKNANRFISEVDSAAVYINASTRFTDGSQLGLGAEVAISTQRLHARGPMALQELTSYKWIIIGENHVRP